MIDWKIAAVSLTALPATGAAAAAMVDWTLVVSAFIAVIPATIAAVAALIQAMKTHKEVNSRMTQMLAMNKTEAAATATVVEKVKQEERKDAKDIIEKSKRKGA